MEDIEDTDYMHAKGVCKVYEIKNLGEYHDFYFKNEALLLTYFFEKLRECCLKSYHVDPSNFLQLLD